MVMCAGTAAADEELWRLRQEVNNLKETLAMQSAYVQTMPPPSRPAGVQASTGTGTQYYLTVSTCWGCALCSPMLVIHFVLIFLTADR
ncbi:hypothetical protein DPMN_179586 [Dreissena polymorpha]|uniref:Uncharacterized protein n=1 Tax=Dreissena polymorpha TaxID=45954 RepID=A0A9D4EEB1_DREPO|nr:hypothetical protein DPMN_179586 [Dreissena polymorpha]